MPARANVRLSVLVLRCQAGDDTAFSELYREFGSGTRRYLSGLLDDESARDLNQEVWLTVFKRISSLDNLEGFRAWLFQTARYRALDYLRRTKRRSELLESRHDEIAKSTSGASATKEGPALIEDLKSSLEKLPAIHREVVILRYWEDLTYAEIALIIGCPVGTIRSRIHHAKTKLRADLRSESIDERR